MGIVMTGRAGREAGGGPTRGGSRDMGSGSSSARVGGNAAMPIYLSRRSLMEIAGVLLFVTLYYVSTSVHCPRFGACVCDDQLDVSNPARTNLPLPSTKSQGSSSFLSPQTAPSSIVMSSSTTTIETSQPAKQGIDLEGPTSELQKVAEILTVQPGAPATSFSNPVQCTEGKLQIVSMGYEDILYKLSVHSPTEDYVISKSERTWPSLILSSFFLTSSCRAEGFSKQISPQ